MRIFSMGESSSVLEVNIELELNSKLLEYVHGIRADNVNCI